MHATPPAKAVCALRGAAKQQMLPPVFHADVPPTSTPVTVSAFSPLATPSRWSMGPLQFAIHFVGG
jgi:hypothetical protein